MKRYIHLLFTVFVLFWTHAQAAADAVAYSVQVPVASYSPVDWQKSIEPALQKVLVQLSGNANITQNSDVRKAIEKPNAFVQSYNYINRPENQSLILEVHFSPEAVNKLLKNNRQSTLTTPQTSSTLSDTNASQAVNMVVSNMHGLQDYTALINYLRHMAGVQDVNSKQTKGDRVLLVLKINIPLESLKQNLDNDHQLVKTPIQNPATPAMAQLLSYRWQGAASLSLTPPAATTGTYPAPVPPPQASSSASPSTEQIVTPVSSRRAPIVEAVPASSTEGGYNTSTDNPSQAQSFGVEASPQFEEK